MPSRRPRDRRVAFRAFLHGALEAGAAALRRTWQAFRRRDALVVVMLPDHRRARTIRREVSAGLRRLRCVRGPLPIDDLTVVVQQVIGSKRPAVGYGRVFDRPSGRREAVLRLALSVHGRELTTDVVLSNLADLYVDLVTGDRTEPVVRLRRVQ